MPPLKPHTHNGTDSDKLYLGNAVRNAPQEALTTAITPATLTSGGSNDLKSADAAILQNAITRLAEVEDTLQALGLLK